MRLLDRWIRRPCYKLIWHGTIFVGGLLLLGGCSGGDYQERFQKSMEHLKSKGTPIPHSGHEAPVEGGGDQGAAPAQPGNG
ncbi:MAG TPA: hypothetical protein VGI75_02230 [Pirellulales bacterium]